MKIIKQHSVKKLFVIILTAVLSIMSVSFIVNAAYINLNSVKRVVSIQSSTGTAFSSNYLLLTSKGTSSYAMKNILFSENADTADFEINVCNYVQNDPSKVNENDIAYTFTLKLLNTDGTVNTGSYARLKVTDGSGVSYSFSDGICKITDQMLTGKTKSVNSYAITVPKEFVNNIDMEASAVPSDDTSYNAANGNKLGRVFSFSVYNASSTTWTGSFTETTTVNYDAFNYVLKGQGKGTVTLSWDPAQLEISNVFIEVNGLQGKVTDGADGTKKLDLEVDSTAKQNRYDIQFYKTENGVYTNMKTVNGYVKISFNKGAD